MNANLEGVLQMVNNFLAYAREYPALYETVLEKLVILANTLDVSSLLQLVAARDAINSLFMMAREAGYHDMAQHFYLLYEELCAALLSYYQGGTW